MGVYIKGMDVPKEGCRNCIFVNRKWHGDICPILKREVTGNVERGGCQTDCPLVPVPEHGRLIDADALARGGWIASRIYHASPTVGVYESKYMNAFPAIIEAEE